ncbi:hypothetical protein VFPPC_15859 [Pochonia chlamydosporia 170]|uniref:Uncharacterized protein n=1 Tax=Pochonia chlamydosporia 170 TaxID=1380566 RepID=A0A179FSQ6_METCM|nr:hypothetical protein VFPPC_15859 [Pochonia chlamydosporia 170]OAQ68655.1 hypothetical protein VFPPC_15859 [Pochonia chlamydosporia 170]
MRCWEWIHGIEMALKRVYESWGALCLNSLIWSISSRALAKSTVLQLERFDTIYLRKMSICGACGDNHCGSARCCRCLDDDRLCRLLTEALAIAKSLTALAPSTVCRRIAARRGTLPTSLSSKRPGWVIFKRKATASTLLNPESRQDAS